MRRQVLVMGLGMLGLAAGVHAGNASGGNAVHSVTDWLSRVEAAPRKHNYIGTMVVSAGAGAMSSARIWHACTADLQVERVDALTGPARSSLRRDDRVVTLLPDQKLVRIERHDALGRFPDLLRSTGAAIADFYGVRPAGTERVAGFEADVVQLAPKDAHRFGYRVWTERRTGLVVKLQTLGHEGGVLEQAAFSELQLDVPLRPEKLIRMMTPPAGWRVERNEAVKTTAAAEGWQLKPGVPGFEAMDCYRRGEAAGAMHCVFSDGIAAVSLFVEPAQPGKPTREGVLAAGATHTLMRRLQDWTITAVGEVPPQTLRTFVQSLERRP
ncbi:MucB/RseB C-terminal domain-containing protein [Ramlibacter rhizophilus]|uniref:MucB/RseB C-terminal domain-containing protein n=1 Tax=Ramlibacter rhizophilus TaxID=1781167 RepID=UPI001F108681|nr:MucB/RseB C-terminal domain-containing protein [Ramlibacter rhizophilus]